jgi:hypothetical protein
MTNPADTPPSSNDRFVPPDAQRGPGEQADELLIHGVLGSLHERAGSVAGARAERVMAAIRAEHPLQESAGTTRVATRRAGRRLRRFVGVPALALAVVFGSLFLVSLPESQAKAAVMASATALDAPGNRRFEVRMMRESDTELAKSPEAIFDTTDGGHFLLRARHPMGFVICAGRDAAGEWAIRRDGGIERDDPRLAWPRWSTDRGESLFVESIGELMKSLALDYRLRDQGLATENGRRVRHVLAVRRSGTPMHLADRVDVWIDVDSHLLERLEMNWDRPRGPGGRPPIGAPSPESSGGQTPEQAGERPPATSEGHADRGPDPRRPEGPGMPGVRPPRLRGPGPDGPRPDAARLDGSPPLRPDGAGRNGPRPDGPRGEAMRPMGPRNGPGGPRPDMGGPGAGPDGPIPGKALRRLVIQRADAPAWPADWFLPESHLKGEWGEPESP